MPSRGRLNDLRGRPLLRHAARGAPGEPPRAL